MKPIKIILIIGLFQFTFSSQSISQVNLFSIQYDWDSTNWMLFNRTFIDDFPSQGFKAKLLQSYNQDSLNWSTKTQLWDTIYFNSSSQVDSIKYYFNFLGILPLNFSNLKNTYTLQGQLDSAYYYDNFHLVGWARKFIYDSNGLEIKLKEYFSDRGFYLMQESQDILRDNQNRDSIIYWADYYIGSPDTIIDIIEKFEYNSIDSISYSSKEYLFSSHLNYSFSDKIYTYNANGYRSRMDTYEWTINNTDTTVIEMKFEYYYNGNMQLDSTVQFRKIPGTSNYLRDHKWEYFPVILDLQLMELENMIHIYPNPASNELKIEIPELNDAVYNVRIFDFMGKLQFENSESSNESLIDVSKYNPGVYFIQLNSKNQNYKGKFIKQ